MQFSMDIPPINRHLKSGVKLVCNVNRAADMDNETKTDSRVPSRPVPPPLPDAAQIPPQLTALERWIAWSYDFRDKGWAKQAFSAVTGVWKGWPNASVHFDVARAGAERLGADGIGFNVTSGDGLVFLDFDDCLQGNALDSQVDMLMKWFPGCYKEITPSGGGIRVVVKGRLARDVISHKLPDSEVGASVELYSGGSTRFVTVTGNAWGEPCLNIENAQLGIDKLLGHIGFCASGSAADDDHPLTVEQVRTIYEKHLASFREMKLATDCQNDTLNNCSLIAARGVLSGVFEKTEEQLKAELRAIALSTPYCAGVEGTIRSGWDSGVAKGPFKIMEDDFPERTATLKEFNDRFYIVENLGGKCRVAWETIDKTTGILTLGHQSFEDFRNRFMNQQIEVGEKKKTSGKGDKETVTTEPIFKTKGDFWLEHPERRQYQTVTFAPGEELGKDVRNLWGGFSVEPKKGDCSLWLTHVRENICKGDQEKYDWLIKWMAWKVRNVGRKSYTAPVFKGTEGIGKNVCADVFAYLFGAHALQVTKKEHISGHFNAHLRACSILIANEAFFAGDRNHEASLKGLITDDYFMIEGKGIDAVSAQNRISLIVISNSDWVVPAGPEARRFAVFDCGDAHKEDTDYFNAIYIQLEGGRSGNRSGYKALLHFLLNEVALTDFDPHKSIRTEALAGQQSQSLHGADQLWYELLYRGTLPGAVEGNRVETERLLKWGQLQHRKWENVTAEQLGFLLGMNPVGVHKGMGFQKVRTLKGNSRVRMWQIPSLRDARAAWDRNRFKVSWPELDPMQTVTAGRPDQDPDDWVIVLVGDEPKSGNGSGIL